MVTMLALVVTRHRGTSAHHCPRQFKAVLMTDTDNPLSIVALGVNRG